MKKLIGCGKHISTAAVMSRRKGATMVEFALIVPILLAILLGILELGWMTKNKLQLANAVREGARDAAVGIKTAATATNDSIEARIKNRAAGLPGAPSALTITLMRDDGDASNGYSYVTPLGNKAADASTGAVYNDAPTGALIRVRVSIPHKSLTGFPFTNGKTLTSEVIMRRESGN